VRFLGNSGESYQVDVTKMFQRTLGNGDRCAVRRRGGKWFYDNAVFEKDHAVKRKWCAYSRDVQTLLESAFRETASCVHQSLRCPEGHPMVIDPRWNHTCNLCGAKGTEFRCSANCDYDACGPCCSGEGQSSSLQESMHDSLVKAEEAIPRSLPSVEVGALCNTFLTSGVRSSEALRGLQTLHSQQGMQFTMEHARCSALRMGSVDVLQFVLCSAPQVQVVGLDVFDRRYPGLVLNGGVKSCIRMLLTRGARLGRFAPAGKLIRKVDADALHAWAERYLNSMLSAGMDLPEVAQQRVLHFL